MNVGSIEQIALIFMGLTCQNSQGNSFKMTAIVDADHAGNLATSIWLASFEQVTICMVQQMAEYI